MQNESAVVLAMKMVTEPAQLEGFLNGLWVS